MFFSGVRVVGPNIPGMPSTRVRHPLHSVAVAAAATAAAAVATLLSSYLRHDCLHRLHKWSIMYAHSEGDPSYVLWSVVS